MDLSKYIKTIPTQEDEPELLERVEEAMQWFASTPEGLQAMKDAVEKHGNPLPILVGSNVFMNSFGYFDGFGTAMALNPELAETTQYITNDCQAHPVGLRAAIAHEYEHARQDFTRPEIEAYLSREATIRAECYAPYTEDFLNLLRPSLDRNLTDEQLRKAVADIYDEYYGPLVEPITQEIKNILAKDGLFTTFIKQYEDPAVAFENHMRKTYDLGPLRNSDYIQSAVMPIDIKASREPFLDEFIPAYRTGKEQQFWRNLIKKGEGRNQSPAFATKGHPRINTIIDSSHSIA